MVGTAIGLLVLGFVIGGGAVWLIWYLNSRDERKVRANTMDEMERLFKTNLDRLHELGELQGQAREPSFSQCGRAGALKARLHAMITMMKMIEMERDDVEPDRIDGLEARRAHIDKFYTGWPGRVEEEYDPQ